MAFMQKIYKIYHRPLMTLLSKAHCIHQNHHRVQLCQLISYKTGRYSEDCVYCAQSSHYQTQTQPLPLMEKK
ncbi:MAG: hypothetical protein R3E91_05270 [Chlamydiales bacterium]